MFSFAEMFGGGPGFPGMGGGIYRRDFRCFSAAMFPNADRKDVEQGGKIIMPPSALEILSRMNIQFPMLFKLTNPRTSKSTHCGVLEFIADEGKIYSPSWMMRDLLLDESDLVSVQSISLPIATYSKFQPQSVDFLDITDPRAVLESALRNFACLTMGDHIVIEYNNKKYELLVMECRPANAVTIIECDMQVDFAPPVGYKEPEPIRKTEAPIEDAIMVDADALPNAQRFEAFAGSGQRLGGNKKKSAAAPPPQPVSEGNGKKKIDVTALGQRGIPNFDWKPGKITFRRNMRKTTVSESDKSAPFVPFAGEGLSLKKGPR